MLDGEYEAAERLLLESQSMWLRGDRSRALDFNGVIEYQIGCCILMQRKIGAAM
jgi:hypothetical protein